jgi:hypothetical protein
MRPGILSIQKLLESIFGLVLICIIIAINCRPITLIAGPGLPLKHPQNALDTRDFHIGSFILCVFIGILSLINFLEFLDERRKKK